MERPDLSNLPSDVIEYIEYLESLVGRRKSESARQLAEVPGVELALNAEPPTSIQVVNFSQNGFAKRTPRHLYIPQHRGGTGNPDLQVEDTDDQRGLAVCQMDATLLLLTNHGRVFRYVSAKLEEKSIRSAGDWLWDRLEREPGEQIAVILPVQASGYLAMVTAKGRVRTLRHHLFGEHMRPGMSVFSVDHGDLVGACWTEGDSDLLVLTRKGIAIRFSEKIVPPLGDQSIKLASDDQAAGIVSVYDDSDVLTVTADGRGSLRQMSGFAANKSLGGSGKILIKSDKVAGAVTVKPDDHVFLLSKLGKVIRFPVGEMPLTDAPVQGVNCMTLRGDEVIAVLKGNPSF